MGNSTAASCGIEKLDDSQVDTRKLVMISDPGQDLDDEMVFILLRCLVELRLVRVLCIIVNLHPSFKRALLCRGTLDMLGMVSVPVGVGTDGGDTHGKHKDDFVETAPYMLSEDSHQALGLHTGRALLFQTFTQAADRSISLCLISSMKDAAVFLRDNEALFKAKVREVTIMGGVHPPTAPGCLLVPDSAHNNEFDRPAAEYLYRRIQELRIPLIVVGRNAAYACPVPRKVYDDLGFTGSPIGWRLWIAQRTSIEALWRRAASSDAEARMGLPARCDAAWFKETFCAGSPQVDNRGPDDIVWDLVHSFNMYDSIALAAAVPALRARLFSPSKHVYKGVEHLIIGASKEQCGIRPDDQALCVDFLHRAYKVGISLDHHHKTLVIVSLSANPSASSFWGLALLKALATADAVDILGVVVSSEMSYLDVTYSLSRAEKIRTFLYQLGLHKALVLVQHGSLNVNRFEELYAMAPCTGISLIVTHAVNDVAAFAMLCPGPFKDKTKNIFLLSSIADDATSLQMALHRRGMAGTMAPSPYVADMFEPQVASLSNSCAVRHGFGQQGTAFLFRKCQELGVPLCVTDQLLQDSVQLPISAVSALEKRCGLVGTMMANDVREALDWIQEQSTLPLGHESRMISPTCDEEWFRKSFDVDKTKADRPASSTARSMKVGLPLLAIVAVPWIREHFFQVETRSVRGATHLIIEKLAPWVKKEDFQRFLVQSICKGLQSDQSDFEDTGLLQVEGLGAFSTRSEDMPVFTHPERLLRGELQRLADDIFPK